MKKIKILTTIIIFILSFLFHFMYDLLPSFINSILFPVNESIFEHMKIIFTSILFTSIIELIIYKKRNINVNNFILNIPIVSIVSNIVYLIIYLIVDKFIGHNTIFSIGLLFIIYIFSQILSYNILNYKKIKYGNIIGLLLIFIIYYIFYLLTYNPIHTYIFLDPITGTYGIEKSNI